MVFGVILGVILGFTYSDSQVAWRHCVRRVGEKGGFWRYGQNVSEQNAGMLVCVRLAGWGGV